MKRQMFAAASWALSLAVVMSWTMSRGAEEAKPTHSIKEVMKVCMKGDLCKKAGSGKASAEEKAQLVEMFVALSQNTPPKGDQGSWKEKTAALITAAKGIQNGAEGSEEALVKAANCTNCHKAHKGE